MSRLVVACALRIRNAAQRRLCQADFRRSTQTYGNPAMTFDTPAYIALIGAGSVFIVTIGVFAFLLTRK
jgi:hypothetical protein